MTATTLDRPKTASGGIPARRAVMRWVWRLFRREWRQQILILLLVIAAVSATIIGAAIASNTPPAPNTGFGSADHRVTFDGTATGLADELAAMRQHFGAIDVIANQPLATGLAQAAHLRAQDPAGTYGRPMLALLTGHFPAGPGEVAMTRNLAAQLDLQPGDVWQHDGRSLRLVGTVENPQSLLDDFALVAPEQITDPAGVTVLFDATSASLATFTFPPRTTIEVPGRPTGIAPAIIVFAIAIIGLIFVGLVATAGFAVVAQRRLRALGMLSALGATNRHVRLVMVTNGALVGSLGALLGAILGLAVWIAYAPHVAVSAHHEVTWTAIPWWLVIASMILAVVTATAASARPARAVANVPTITALSGRPPAVKAVHRSAVPGAIVLAIALLMLAFSGGWGGNGGKDTGFQLLGLLGTAAGLLLLAPLTIAALGIPATRAPISIRIALRDLARYRSRSGAALAAGSFAVFIAVLVTLITTGRYADPVDYFGPNLAANQIVVQFSHDPTTPPITPAHATDLQARADAIAAAVNSHDVLPMESTDAFLGHRVNGGIMGGPETIYLATPAVLAHYGIDPTSIKPTTLLVSSRTALEVTPDLVLVGGGTGPDPQAVRDPALQIATKLPTDTSAPNLLATPAAVAQLHLSVTADTWLIQAPHPLTASQISTARQIAAAATMTIDTKSDAPSLATVRDNATYAGILLALGVLAMTVGLIRSESAGELRTLTATGAGRRTRRIITATTAGTLGLLSAVLGTAVAYAASAAFFRSQLSERMGQPPTLSLLLILIGLPVLASVGGWMFAGRQPAAIARQPIE